MIPIPAHIEEDKEDSLSRLWLRQLDDFAFTEGRLTQRAYRYESSMSGADIRDEGLCFSGDELREWIEHDPRGFRRRSSSYNEIQRWIVYVPKAHSQPGKTYLLRYVVDDLSSKIARTTCIDRTEWKIDMPCPGQIVIYAHDLVMATFRRRAFCRAACMALLSCKHSAVTVMRDRNMRSLLARTLWLVHGEDEAWDNRIEASAAAAAARKLRRVGA